MVKKLFGRRNADPAVAGEKPSLPEAKLGATAVAAANTADEVQNPLRPALDRARALLRQEVADIVLPEDGKVLEIKEQTFRSRTFRNAAYDAMPERYGDHDRSLTTLTLDGGGRVFIAAGKISSGNPYEVDHAAGGGIDLRQTYGVAYAYDGQQTITEYMPDGSTHTYEGEFGTPAALLPHLESNLGEPVGTAVFVRPDPQQ